MPEPDLVVVRRSHELKIFPEIAGYRRLSPNQSAVRNGHLLDAAIGNPYIRLVPVRCGLCGAGCRFWIHLAGSRKGSESSLHPGQEKKQKRPLQLEVLLNSYRVSSRLAAIGFSLRDRHYSCFPVLS